MKKTTANNLVAIAFLVLFIRIAIMTTAYGPRARLVPLPVAICSIILVCFQLYLQNSKNTKLNLKVDAGEVLFGQKEIKKSKSDEKKENSVKKELASFSVVLVFLALILILGVEPAIFVFVTGYFRFINKDKWLKSLLFGVGTLVFVHLLFVTFLNVNFYEGIFETIL
ncbi:MAG: tripartite tricarboxylate transporter TctB family protein [Clostridia bacterium]|nr:tripartite tricarboxylate transporter TctB family protein [Clostridia bacterium]